MPAPVDSWRRRGCLRMAGLRRARHGWLSCWNLSPTWLCLVRGLLVELWCVCVGGGVGGWGGQDCE